MFIGLFIGFCIIAFSLVVWLYKTMTISVFKLLAFGIDYFVLVFYAIYFFHPYVAVKIASGNWIYALDVLCGIITILLYTVLLSFLTQAFPNISSALNLFMAFIGVMIALPFTLSLIIPIIQVFNKSFGEYLDKISLAQNHMLNLSQSHMLNIFLTYLIFGIIALPIWRYRVDKLNGEA